MQLHDGKHLMPAAVFTKHQIAEKVDTWTKQEHEVPLYIVSVNLDPYLPSPFLESSV